MANEEIQKYIKECRAQNIGDDVIKSELLKVGWPEADVLMLLIIPKAKP